MNVQVKEVFTKGQSSLVEWVLFGVTHRAYVPTQTITGGEASVNTLDQGIPYGDPFADIFTFANCNDIAARFEAELHRHGLWSMQDIGESPKQVAAILQSVYGQELASVLRAAKSYKKEKRDG